MNMKRIIFLTVIFLTLNLISYAGGYQVRLKGQKQTGMGLVGTSMQFGASSIFYNPGALSMMEQQYSFSVGANFIMSNVVYQSLKSTYSAETDNPLSTPAYIYGATKLSDKLALGIGFYTPFGSTNKWDDDWAGRLLVQEISFQSFFIQPTLSYQLNDKIGFGAGLALAQGNVELKRGLPYNGDSYVKLKGSDFNVGFNVGIFYKPTEKLNIGLNYRSEIKMQVEGGDANFFIPDGIATLISKENKFSAELPLPANLDFGLSYQITPEFLVGLEVNYVFWSTYKELSFVFEQDGELLNSTNPRDYSDSFIPRLGLQYKLNDMFVFRTGAYYDPTPTNENYFTPETVSLDTYAFTFGTSIHINSKLDIDLSYLQTLGKESTKAYKPENFEGIYKTAASIFGLGINYKF
jgi:long-chain fatty acid transport protein